MNCELRIAMVRALLTLLLLCASAAPRLHAATEITATVTITNTPAGLTSNLTVNIGAATTRYWTNNASAAPSSNIQTTNSPAASVTNLLAHFSAYPVYSAGAGTPQALFQAGSVTTNFTITAPLNTNLTVTISGGWAGVTYATNTYADGGPLQWPTNLLSAFARTQALNAIVNYLAATNREPSNTIPPAAQFLRHYTDNTSAQTLSNKTLTTPVINGGRFVNATNLTGTNVALTNVTLHLVNLTAAQLSGFISAITNGYWTNASLDKPYLTNASASRLTVTDGSLQAESLSVSFYSDTAANQPFLLIQKARGDSTNPTNLFAGDEVGSIDILGRGASQYKFAFQIMALAAADFSNSSADTVVRFVIGRTNSSTATDIMGFRWGVITNYADVYFPSNIIASGTTTLSALRALGGSVSNALFWSLAGTNLAARDATLTGTNILNGRLDLTPRANSSLANGYNSGVILGTNVYIRLSGPSGAYTNAGFAAAVDGTYHVLQFDNPVSNFTILNDSGLEATAANRILTGTGGLLNYTNNPAILHVLYDANASRWRILTDRR